jgi:lysylphosphatidylglycerol synthetase-like protein (DUF2156 family)
MAELQTPPRIARKRLALAFTVAAVSDIASIFLTLAPPMQWFSDGVTALLLFMVLGWQWILLPGLIMEAIPGLAVIPFWVLVVSVVAIWGTARPDLKSMFRGNEKAETPRDPRH